MKLDLLRSVGPLGHRYFFIKNSRNYPAEISAMRMLRARTTIPVPRPLFMLPWAGYWLMVMTISPGISLKSVWSDAPSTEKDDYVQQLGKLMHQLRRLKSPFGPGICSAGGSELWDPRIKIYDGIGPFKNECDFNESTVRTLALPHPPPSYYGHDIPHRVTFTHGDFARRNIMVQNGRVTAIVDWETAGWYPAHWEYLKSMFVREPWVKDIPKMVPPFGFEWEIEATRTGELSNPLF